VIYIFSLSKKGHEVDNIQMLHGSVSVSLTSGEKRRKTRGLNQEKGRGKDIEDNAGERNKGPPNKKKSENHQSTTKRKGTDGPVSS